MTEPGVEPAAAPPDEATRLLAAQAESTRHRTLARGAALLVGAQFLTTPISIVLNMLLTRRLGAEEFGSLFLAANLTTFTFLFVDWGQSSSISGATARDPDAAPRLLGTGLSLKLAGSVAAAGLLWVVGLLLHYTPQVRLALVLTCLQTSMVSLAASYGAVLRGRERLDRVSQLTIIAGLINFCVVVPALLLGGHLLAVLAAQCAGSAISLCVYIWRSRQVGVVPARPERETARQLLHVGSGFLVFGVVVALQPAVDSVLLSKLAPAEVVGWYSAAQRFIGVLIFPATTLNYTIYPMLAKLAKESSDAFLNLIRAALRVVVIFGVPAALGCALFAPIVIRLFCGPNFSPAAPVLRVYSIFVFFVYFSIVVGAALAARGKIMQWALVQLICVGMSVIADPLLIPVCQRVYGNGAIGVSITAAISETMMVTGALWLAPRGVLNRGVILSVVRCLLAGGGMLAAGLLCGGLPWQATVPISVAAYGAVLALVGGVDREQLAVLTDVIRRKKSSALARR